MSENHEKATAKEFENAGKNVLKAFFKLDRRKDFSVVSARN